MPEVAGSGIALGLRLSPRTPDLDRDRVGPVALSRLLPPDDLTGICLNARNVFRGLILGPPVFFSTYRLILVATGQDPLQSPRQSGSDASALYVKSRLEHPPPLGTSENRQVIGCIFLNS